MMWQASPENMSNETSARVIMPRAAYKAARLRNLAVQAYWAARTPTEAKMAGILLCVFAPDVQRAADGFHYMTSDPYSVTHTRLTSPANHSTSRTMEAGGLDDPPRPGVRITPEGP